MFFRIARTRAIGGNVNVEAAHVRVMRRDGDATVRRQPGQNQGLHLQMLQQHFQRRHVERGVHRLQHEVVFAVRQQRPYKLRPLRLQAAAHQHFLFAAPVAEVIVHVQHRDAGLTRPRLQPDQSIPHGKRASQNRVSIGKLKRCQDVN